MTAQTVPPLPTLIYIFDVQWYYCHTTNRCWRRLCLSVPEMWVTHITHITTNNNNNKNNKGGGLMVWEKDILVPVPLGSLSLEQWLVTVGAQVSGYISSQTLC